MRTLWWLFQRLDQASHHRDSHRLRSLFYFHNLEAPRERGILLEVFLVFGPCGGGDGAEFAARQRRLRQVGGIAPTKNPAAPINWRASSMTPRSGSPNSPLTPGARLEQTKIECFQRQHGPILAARRRTPGGPRSLPPPPSCQRRPRLCGLDCSAEAASGARCSRPPRRRSRLGVCRFDAVGGDRRQIPLQRIGIDDCPP